MKIAIYSRFFYKKNIIHYALNLCHSRTYNYSQNLLNYYKLSLLIRRPNTTLKYPKKYEKLLR